MDDITRFGLTSAAMVVFVIGLLIYSLITTQQELKRACASKGGVVVHTYGADNCWKDNGYINVE